MGMFDRIWFQCLKCGGAIEHQSKAGLCLLQDIQQEAVPQMIAADIVGEQVWCGKCSCGYTIVALDPPPQTVAMGLA